MARSKDEMSIEELKLFEAKEARASGPVFRSNGWFRHPRRWRGQVPLSALHDPALNKYLTL